MSGYFSRIAKHSGARLAGDGPHVHAVKGAAEGHPLPIEHEETVVVSPSEHSGLQKSEPVGKNIGVADSRSPRRRGPSGRATAPADPVKISSEGAPELIKEEVRLAGPAAQTHSGVVPRSPASTPVEDKNYEPVNRIVTDPSPKTVDAETPVTGAITVQPSEKKFFEKTTELVASQAGEPAEVETVLLREVQEWIAAGQAVPEETSTEVPASFERAEVETLQAVEKQPGVVRILEGRRREMASSETVQELSTPTSINEQNVEISIGSISVVVEGDDKLPAPAPPATAAQTGSGTTPRRTSRLSRHYL